MKRTPSAEIDEICVYCEESAPLNDSDFVLCRKRGIVRAQHQLRQLQQLPQHRCRRFAYDPLKRMPAEHKVPKLDFIDIEK